MRVLGAAALLLALGIGGVPTAFGDGASVHSGGSAFSVGAIHEVEGDQAVPTGGGSGEVQGHYEEEPACAQHGAQTCGEVAFCADGSVQMNILFVPSGGVPYVVGTSCPENSIAPVQPQVTPGLVLAALRRIGLPPSELNVQPPNGRTLVNFDTNFYTENGEFTRTVTLLGQRVELRIWPARYGWRFGDGRQRWTTTPGDAYPHLEVTHRYLRKGRVSPSVDTTYAAQFRVNGGPWRDVNGTVTIPGTPQQLRVVTARPVLVGG